MNIQGQEFLIRHLLQFGADIYEGQFPTLGDRLKHAISIHGLERVVVGRHEGKPITYRQAWEMTYRTDFGDAR